MLARFLHRLEVLAREPTVRWFFFSLLAAAAAWPYLATAGAFNGFRDAQVLWLYEDQARRSVLDFGQLPLWNPDFCGGLPALATPQSRFASPPFLLTLLFGTTRAEPLVVFAMVLLALFGAYRFARSHGARALGATLGAPLFGLMGVFACAPFLGWFGFLGFALLPWVLEGVRRAAKGDQGGVVQVALATAFIVGFGGTYVAPITLVACVVEIALLAGARRGRIALGPLAAAGVLALGASAFRLWPVWEELHRGPRVIAGLSGNGILSLGANLFGTWPILTNEVWYLVTVPGAVLASLALLRRRAWWVLGPVLVWLWLASGNASTPSLYTALRGLPVFSMLRASERFLVPLVLTCAVAASLALSHAVARVRLGRRPRRAKALLAFAALCLALALPWQLDDFRIAASRRALSAPPEEVQRPFHQARGNRWHAASFGPMSRGSLACWEAYAVPESPKLRADAEEEAWLADAGAGTVEATRWSPNALGFRLSLARPARLVVNQNYHRGWRASVGEVLTDDGLLAVELPAGTHDVSLRFLPTSAVGGLATSGLALLVLALWRRRAWTTGARVGLALAPLAVGALFAVTSPEPRLAAPVPAGPEGEPLLVDAPPEGSRVMHVGFTDDVVLEAASLTYRPGDDRVRLELDWSRGPNVNPRLGIFVHIEPGTMKRIPADHLQLSDALLLEQIPVGQLGRDIMLVDAPADRRGPPWNVWVGLWEMRGDGHRLHIESPNGATIGSERVLVGTVKVPDAPPAR